MFIPDVSFLEMICFLPVLGFIPALIMAGASVAGAIAGKKGQQRSAENQRLEAYNRKVWEEQNFDPYGPFRRGVRGAVWAATMKTWGFDKMFPKEMMDYVADPRNVPGTDKVLPGGKAYSQPSETGMPQPKTGMGFWDWASAGLGGAAAFGQASGYGGGGGGGRSPGPSTTGFGSPSIPGGYNPSRPTVFEYEDEG